jgi:Glucose / Sorbosone dehydrogenase
LGKVLRINRDGSVPADNPFRGSPIFTVGNRNPYGIEFYANGMGIITDNGYSHYDEINVLRSAGNYGFPTYQIPSFSSLNSLFISPVRSYYDVVAPTQALFYTGQKYPALHYNFVIGSYNNQQANPINALSISKRNSTADPIHVLSISKGNSSIEEKAIVFSSLPKDNIIAVAVRRYSYQYWINPVCNSLIREICPAQG